MDHQTIADKLLWPLWRAIPDQYKSKYRRNIWDQFQDALSNAAYSNSLASFVSQFCDPLDAQVRSEDLSDLNSVLVSGEDRSVLHTLRSDTTALVVFVRLRNQERSEAYEASLAEKRETQKQERMEDSANADLEF